MIFEKSINEGFQMSYVASPAIVFKSWGKKLLDKGRPKKAGYAESGPRNEDRKVLLV